MHLGAFVAAFRTPDLRKKILFTLAMLAIFRLGSVVPTPGVDYSAIQRCIDQTSDNSVYAVINLFSGGALLQLSVFALGIMPYITASIIMLVLLRWVLGPSGFLELKCRWGVTTSIAHKKPMPERKPDDRRDEVPLAVA